LFIKDLEIDAKVEREQKFILFKQRTTNIGIKRVKEEGLEVFQSGLQSRGFRGFKNTL